MGRGTVDEGLESMVRTAFTGRNGVFGNGYLPDTACYHGGFTTAVDAVKVQFSSVQRRYDLAYSAVGVIRQRIHAHRTPHATVVTGGKVPRDVSGMVKEIFLPLVVYYGVMVGTTVERVRITP